MALRGLNRCGPAHRFSQAPVPHQSARLRQQASALPAWAGEVRTLSNPAGKHHRLYGDRGRAERGPAAAERTTVTKRGARNACHVRATVKVTKSSFTS